MDPVAFNIGDFSIRWYGILIGLGALVGMLLAYYNAKKLKLDNIFNFIIIGGSMMGSIIQKEQVENTIIAYEPIWAIGTGKTATKEDANESIKSIRNKISEIYGQETANRVIIQYGGSVKSGNSKELFEMSDIDGGLVGGASLKAEEFSKIVNFDK